MVTIACRTRMKMSRITPDGTKLKAPEFRTLAEFAYHTSRPIVAAGSAASPIPFLISGETDIAVYSIPTGNV
jgi:hypothetical protein